MTVVAIILSYLPFYLLGTFPTGYLLARAKGVDITEHGSGNVGATNVARVLGKKAGIVTLLMDVLKGLVAVTLAGIVSSLDWYAGGAGVAVVAGHCFSLPPVLRGGKGVATSLGAIIGLNPWAALGAIAVFALVFFTSKIVSLSSISAALTVPIVAFLATQGDAELLALTGIALLVVYRHKENLIRLSEGREPKFSSKKGREKDGEATS